MIARLPDIVRNDAPVLVLAPHPDDESLGCGTLLAELWRWGRAAHVACLTDGAASHRASRRWPGPRLARMRRDELSRAVTVLGGRPARDVTWMGFPDAALHRVPGADPVRAILSLVDRLGIGTLVAASPDDPHCDHVAGADAVRRVRAARPRLDLVFYPVWSRWHRHVAGEEQAAALHLDLPRRRAVKAAAIAMHRSQAGTVVNDDPAGFSMPPGFAEYFAARPEHYVRVRA